MVNETGNLAGIPQGGEEENFDSYEKLLDQYGARKFAEGEVMKGTVLKITETDVIVDIGYKSEGVIPVAQFVEPGGHLSIAVGDVIDVLLEDTEDGDGHIVLSKEKAEKVRVWEHVEKAYNDNAIIRGRVIERIKNSQFLHVALYNSPEFEPLFRSVTASEHLIQHGHHVLFGHFGQKSHTAQFDPYHRDIPSL